MTSRIALFAWLGVFLALAACNSGPSSTGPSSAREAETARLERKVDFLESLIARRPQASEAFEALASALPDRAWLTEIVYDPKGIQAKGNAPSNTILADYMSRLAESPSLTDVTLRGSSLRTVRDRERVEFLLQAAARGAVSASPASGGSSAARLAELEKVLPARQDPSEMLRELQRLALGSGLQMTKFVPGVEVAGEFAGELAATIEVAGDQAEVGGYLRNLAALPRLWVVERLTLKAVLPDDPRQPVR